MEIKTQFEDGLTFDDVYLIPQYSDIKHRSDVDISSKVLSNIKLSAPFVAANMDTITEYNMAFTMAQLGALGILHRYMSNEEMLRQIDLYREKFKEANLAEKPLVISIGVKDPRRMKIAYENGIRDFCIDVAHGHHALVKDTIAQMREDYGEGINIIAGNVCTYEGAYALYEWGADCIKVGVGPGSVCTTRMKTGAGYPQLSAVISAKKAKTDFIKKSKAKKELFIIADGGIKVYGDITKALAAGADAVMMGSMFAGCKETPGSFWRNEKEEIIKSFRGMASAPAQNDFGIEDINEEGVALTVKYRGGVRHLVKRMIKGVRSGFSYSGARSLTELQEQAKFVKITTSGFTEGKPHKTL